MLDETLLMEAPLVAGKSFSTAVASSVIKKTGEEEQYDFEVDGVQCVAFKPSEAQLAMALASMGRFSKDTDQIAAVINFLVGILDDRTNSYIVNRLLDRTDPFGLEQVQDILEWLIEEWSGRPTQKSSGSTESPPSTGPSSTLTIPAST